MKGMLRFSIIVLTAISWTGMSFGSKKNNKSEPTLKLKKSESLLSKIIRPKSTKTKTEKKRVVNLLNKEYQLTRKEFSSWKKSCKKFAQEHYFGAPFMQKFKAYKKAFFKRDRIVNDIQKVLRAKHVKKETYQEALVYYKDTLGELCLISFHFGIWFMNNRLEFEPNLITSIK
jgi:hypothetical protein